MRLHRSIRARSGFLGVYQDLGTARTWRAQISHPPGKVLFLGVYPTARAAARKVWEALQTIKRKPGQHPRRTHCKWGHVWQSASDTSRSTLRHDGYYRRQCRRCEKERDRTTRYATRRQYAARTPVR